MKTFHCDNCSKQVFFENTVCNHCGWMLGYQPEHQIMSSFTPADQTEVQADAAAEAAIESDTTARWRSVNPLNAGKLFRQCRNYAQEEVCNWMLDDQDAHALCASCRLTAVIPSLDDAGNRILWQRLEVAKRRLLHSLWTMRLQPPPKPDDAGNGLSSNSCRTCRMKES